MKIIKLLHRKLGLVDESVLRSATDEADVRNEWKHLYGFFSAARFENFKILVIESELLSPYTLPQKLTKSKYDLVMFNLRPKCVVTESRNREQVLKELIKTAKDANNFYNLKYAAPYKIYLTENGIKSVLLDSKLDKQFINFLYEDNRQA